MGPWPPGWNREVVVGSTTPERSGERPLRVLWLIKGLGRGGAEMLLAAHAAAAGPGFAYEVGYVLPYKDALVPNMREHGVVVHDLGAPGGTWVARLRQRLRQDPPIDVIHAHSPVPASAARILVRTLPKSRRPAVVTTEHNRWPRYHPATRYVNWLTYGMDAHHVLVSEDIRETLPARYQASAEVLVHGVDRAALAAVASERDAARAELGVDADTVLVVTIANLQPKKGYPFLLQAAADVCQQRDDVQFVAAGTGPREAELRDQHAQLGLGDRFAFLGFRDDAPRLLAAADVFCLASLHEGLPVTLMEAMTLGRPIVATTAGGIPEAVRDGQEARLVPPGDAGALRDALLQVVGDPALRERMSAASRERSAAFDVSRAAARLEEIYRDVAGEAMRG
jgi:glycosyltransferase involved in cell wall biosynthesis